MKDVDREFLLGFWKIHILHHAGEEPVHGLWLLNGLRRHGYSISPGTRQRQEYAVGVVLENIQAQQELTRARTDYLTAIAEYNKAQYGLARAIGAVAAPDNAGRQSAR